MAGMKWLRLWPDYVLNGTTFDELDAEQRGVWFSLLVLAGYSSVPGTICIAAGIPYADGQLAQILKLDLTVLLESIDHLASDGIRKVIRNADGTLTIANWLKYQTEYERQKRYRRGLHGHVTHKGDSTDIDTETDPEVGSRSRSKRGEQLPADFKLEGRRQEYAKGQGLTAAEAQFEFDKFKDWHLSKGSIFKDWDAAWRTWVRNALQFNKRRGSGKSSMHHDFPS